MDRIMEQMTFREGAFRFHVAEQVATSLPAMLDITRDAISFANERTAQAEDERARASAVAQEQQAQADRQLADAADQWAKGAGLA
jgi:hypothetical protein